MQTACISRLRRAGLILPERLHFSYKNNEIEVKTDRDKPRPDQMKVKQQIEPAGGLYIFIRSFDEFLEQIQPMVCFVTM
jgi:hypothetical protein